MHPVDIHKNAVAFANQATWLKFDERAPYTPDTPAHTYWLEKYDQELARHYGTRRSDG